MYREEEDKRTAMHKVVCSKHSLMLSKKSMFWQYKYKEAEEKKKSMLRKYKVEEGRRRNA